METTKIVTAQTKSQSLRTTIPSSIVRQFKLKPGDELEWELVVRDNVLVLELRPAKTTDSPNIGEGPSRKTTSRSS